MSQNVRVTLTKLRDVFRRIDRGTLDADDWPIVRALFSKEIARCERRQAKMLANILPSNAARTVSNRGRYRRFLTGDGISGSDAVFTE